MQSDKPIIAEIYERLGRIEAGVASLKERIVENGEEARAVRRALTKLETVVSQLTETDQRQTERINTVEKSQKDLISRAMAMFAVVAAMISGSIPESTRKWFFGLFGLE